MKGHMQDGKFHPHTVYQKGVRKSRDQKAKTKGVKVKERKQKQVMATQLAGMSQAMKKEWEDAVGSEVVKVKKEMMNGRPVTSVRFANGEEWFEFDHVNHQEEFMKQEKIEADDSIVGEFVEIDHPDIAGYITMEDGKVLFGERENRSKRDRAEVEKEVIKEFESSKHITEDEKFGEMVDKEVEKRMKEDHTRKQRAVHKDFFENPKGRLECRHCGHLTSREWSDLGCDCQTPDEGDDE